jgi:hypothetical protein
MEKKTGGTGCVTSYCDTAQTVGAVFISDEIKACVALLELY